MPRVISLFVYLFIFNSGIYAQLLNKEISISYQDKSIPDILQQLEETQDLRFSYNPDILPDRLVSGDFDQVQVRAVLDEMLGANAEYKIRGSYIIIQSVGRELPKKEKYQFSGEIVDAVTGKKLPYTTVYEVDKLTSSLTDNRGNFAIAFSTNRQIAHIAISKENYQDTVIKIDRRNPFPRTLKLRPLNFKFEAGERFASAITEHSTVASLFVSKKTKENTRNVDLEETRVFQLSFIPGLSTNGQLNSRVYNQISINMISGYANGLAGAEIGGVVNIIREDVYGAQISGFSNITGGASRGTAISGFINTNRADVTGLQMAGFMNVTGAMLTGSQIGGFMNHSDSVKGVQAGGFLNNGGVVKGAQIGGFTNISKDINGTQISGFSNHAKNVKGFHLSGFYNGSKHLNGIQIAGFMNRAAGELTGVQFSGLINQADSVSGVQIGVVNFSKKVKKGVTIGFLNFVKEGFKRGGISHNDITDINLLFLSGTTKFYSILTGGIKRRSEGVWSYGAGFGTRMYFNEKWHSSVEVTANGLQPTDTHLKGLFLDNRLLINVGYDITERLSINAGPLIHYFIADNKADEHDYFPAKIGRGGFVDRTGARIIEKAWVGYHLSIRF